MFLNQLVKNPHFQSNMKSYKSLLFLIGFCVISKVFADKPVITIDNLEKEVDLNFLTVESSIKRENGKAYVNMNAEILHDITDKIMVSFFRKVFEKKIYL